MSETGDDIEHRHPDALTPHPENEEIYGDRGLEEEGDDGFVDSIREKGVRTPVIVDQGDVIISGHRRVEAAKQVGLETVPVITQEYESDIERLEELVDLNRQRDKTFRQQMREAEALERVERERAKQRQGKRTDLVENLPAGDNASPPDDSFGATRDKVGETIGIGSGRKYDMAKTVWEAAKDGDTVAKHEVDKIDREEQSVYGAYEKVRDRLDDASDDDEPETPDEDVSTSDDDRKRVSADEAVLSAHIGRNDEVFPDVLDLHVDPGSKVADVTYGKGAFWRRVPSGKYDLTATDIDPSRSPDSSEGIDCRELPYDDASFDCIVLDPPYAEGFYDPQDKPSDNDFWIADRYLGESGEQTATYHEAVLEMYARAGEEAHRVLREGGMLIAKMQDEVSRDEQRLTHIEVTEIYDEMGFHAKDLFVVVRRDTPTIGRMYEQRRARKNHSYFLVYEMQC